MKKKSFFRKLPIVSLALLLSASFAVPSVGYADLNPDIRSQIELKAVQSGVHAEETAEAYISPEISTSSSREINVIVQLSSEPAAVGKFAAHMGLRSMSAASMESAATREQSSFEDQAKRLGIPIQVNYRYNTVLNGLEVTVPADRIPELAAIPGVKSVYENKTYYSIPVQEAPVLSADQATYDNAPLDQINVPEAWAKGLTGKGLKVGVIDTGVDYKHPDLIDAYKGGWDSFEQDNDPYEEPPISIEDDPFGIGFAGTSHGTHVSGTVAGRAANKNSDIYQKGVAYEADLYVYKVLGRNAETGRASGSSAQVIDGIERAVKDGMDVINLSLGSDVEKDANSPDSMAVNNAVLSGVVAVVANGNAADKGPYYYSMGSPAGAQLAISVGAVTSPSYYFNASASVTQATYQGEAEPTVSATEATYSDMDLNVMGWKVAGEDFASILGTEPIELVYADLGQAEDFENLDVKDKVVLISRGNLAFVDKLANAKLKGARAVIFFNGNTKPGNANEADLSESIANRDGFIATILGESFEFIPTFDMQGALGRGIARQIVGHPDEAVTVTFGGAYPRIDVRGDTMASFSSRGPNADGFLGIKPDLVAPGVNIRSTWPAYGLGNPDASYDEAYNRNSGTSMASPHVAGLALLLLQQNPDWSPFDVRAALANTSDSLFDENNQLYDVYSQGAGRADVGSALETPALLQTVEQLTILDKQLNPKQVVNYGSSASFGIGKAGSGAQMMELQLKNISGSKVQYKATIELHDSVTSDPLNPIKTPDVNGISANLVGISTEGTISAEAGKSQPFFLSVERKDTAVDGVYEGAVVLEASGLPSLHLPFSLHVGEAPPATGYGIQELSFTPTVITPNGDGKHDSANLSFRITEDVNYMRLLVIDLQGNELGIVGEFIKEDDTGGIELLDQGYYKIPIDGTYTKLDKNGSPEVDKDGKWVKSKLKDGTYSIGVYAYLIGDKGLLKKYEAYRAFRVDNTPATNPGDGNGSGGNNGGGSSGGSGGGAGGSSTTPTPTPGPAQPAPSGAPALQSVMKQGQVVKSVPTAAVVKDQIQSLTVKDEDLQAAVSAAGTSPSAIVLSVSKPEGQTTKAVLTPSQLAILLKSATGSSLIISNTSSSMSVPIAVLKSVPAGSSLELIIGKGDSFSGVFTKGFPGVTLIGSPVTFDIQTVNSGTNKGIKLPAGQRILSSFTVPGQLEAYSAGVLYAEDGKVNPAPSVLTKQKDGTTVVTVSRSGVSTYAAASRPVKFTDISSSYAQSQIKALAGKLLMNGTSETTFSPKNNVTRAEFASMLSRALGLTPSTATPFTDVKAGSWYAGHVAAAYEAGLIGGHANGSFDPNASISRQDMSVMLAKAIALLQIEPKAEGPARVPYGDAASLARYAQQSIEAVTALGLMNGETSGGVSYFRPQAPTTREAAAKVLYILLQKGELIN
ncbi:Serine protease, subtilisin family [Paenibacillus uliginis N3/975]|uniref:Serine protease, subtilisin family n=1 Tax=Paenibacillus uliginis N3/975 TaxID=1313296 RepID=A0A1X7G696_9BACL|nr:S8 family serine peptidase [Paenibacillus uliginis]SMF64827.1 Serine protease, subtilisin family [Paenibacillus uliginis N3/975]